METFKCAIAIDLSEAYYHIPVEIAPHKLYTTVPPWSKYKNEQLPMGIAAASDISKKP